MCKNTIVITIAGILHAEILPEGGMSTSSCRKGRGSQEEGTPPRGTWSEGYFNWNCFGDIKEPRFRLFRYLQLQSKTGYGQGKGRDSYLCYCACADVTASAARKVSE